MDQQIKLTMCVGRIFPNSYAPEYVPEDLPWYKRDVLVDIY